MVIRLFSVLVLLLAMGQSQRWPESNPFVETTRDEWQRAYRDFRPGPSVAAEVKRLDDRAGDLHNQLAREEITPEHFSIESQRVSIHRHLLLCTALVAAPRDDIPQLLVVLANHRELMRIFPSGKLPVAELQPNQIYETEPGSRWRVRYLTIYRWDRGEKFAVFARESKE